jgi:hypothetical protein
MQLGDPPDVYVIEGVAGVVRVVTVALPEVDPAQFAPVTAVKE